MTIGGSLHSWESNLCCCCRAHASSELREMCPATAPLMLSPWGVPSLPCACVRLMCVCLCKSHCTHGENCL
ncbi:hypothetical protein P4O66_011383 [Electrophorus voltai]|uniref:Uncharacterized protein n=1 Tax=Electrophorus voltai TaxID=2609070 RepID=A0AAD8Z5N7_9TELE|nr:hypothetical protein P4O66_011383 [Electrophorus voltai]